MDAERPSEDGIDPDGSLRGESDSECSCQCSEEETDISSDEQPGTSRRRGGGISHPCTYPGCKLVFRRPGRLKAHMHLHNGQRPFKCLMDGCSRSYTNSSHLKRHLKVSHEDGAKQRTVEFMCSSCSLKKTYRKGRRNAPKIPSKYIKEYCAPSLGANICFECGKAFRNVLREPKPTGAFTLCHVCGHCFESSRDFRRHERGHITYQCPYVGCKNREFSFIEMRKHLSQHSGYTCNDCNKKFPNKASLREHVACHLNVRQVFHCPFKEANCERKYFHRRNLTQHIKTAHNKKRFPCEICSADFCTKQKLTGHKARIHSQDPESKVKPKGKPKKQQKVRKGPKLLKASMVHIMLGIRVVDDTSSKEEGI